jgi:hypothetical protein
MEFPDIVAGIDQLKRSKIKKVPAMANRASYLGDDCERKLYYLRAEWDKAEETPLELQYIFEEGHQQEKVIIADMIEAGFKIIRQQEPFTWADHQITGSIDGMIVMPDQSLVPFDAKSMSPHVWDKVSDVESLKRFTWTKKYVAQIILYMLMSNQERGVLVFKNKSNGRFKQLNFLLSDFLDLAEEQLQKADRVNVAVATKTPPDRLEEPDHCRMCQFRLHCLPDQNFDHLEFIDNEELVALLEKKEQLKPYRDQYDDIDDQIKEQIKGREFVCGNYHISGKWIEKKESVVRASKYWKSAIKKIGE